MRALASLSPLCLLLLPLPVRADEVPAEAAEPSPPEPDSFVLPLVLHGGFKGELGLPDCRAEGEVSVEVPAFARLVRAGRAAIEDAEARGHLAPLFLHTGDLHYPGALPSFLASQGADGVGELLGLVRRVPYDGVALGGLDLSAPADDLPVLFDRVAETGFPLLASNIRCEAGALVGGLCRASGTAGGSGHRVVSRGPLRIALLSVLDPAHTTEISARKREGLTFAEIEESVAAQVDAIRQGGEADLVVLIAHTFGKTQERALLESLQKLPGLDLVVLKQLRTGSWGKLSAPEGGSVDAGWASAPVSGTLVLPAGRGTDEQVRAELRVERTEDGWRLVPLRSRLESAAMYEPAEGIGERVTDVARRFCAERGRPVAQDLPLAGPMDEEAFTRWALDVMRDEAKAEIAILNAGAVRNKGLLPLRDHITRADLHGLLPFGGALVTGRLKGEDLMFLGGLLGSKVLSTGLERDDGPLKINGRSIEPDRKYRVVLNRFVADGGDEILLDGSLSKREDLLDERGDPVDLVALLERSLTEGRFAHKKDGSLHPDRRFVDLHRKPRFRFAGSINAAYSKILVTNPELDDGTSAYDKGELAGSSSADTLYFDLRTSMKADSRFHEVRLFALLYYSLARYAEELGGTLETGDTIRGTAVYDFNGLRVAAGGKGYVPIPYAELELLSEFDRPKTREWHRLQGTGILGVKLRPLAPLSLKVGANVRREFLDPDASTLAGLFVGYSLDRVDLFKILKRPVQLESETDWFYNDPGTTDVHEIRHYTRLYFGLLDRLFFSTTFSAYLYREKPVGEWGAYMDLTIGINGYLAGSVQAL